jgi:hypothetical protein
VGEGSDLLAFVGFPPVRVALLPPAQQFAEQLHALTLPRAQQANTRTKDLVDVCLLLEAGLLSEPALVLRAVRASFVRRQTHPLPDTLPIFPATWRAPFADLAETCRLQRATVEEGTAALSAFWHEVVSALPHSPRRGHREGEALEPDDQAGVILTELVPNTFCR